MVAHLLCWVHSFFSRIFDSKEPAHVEAMSGVRAMGPHGAKHSVYSSYALTRSYSNIDEGKSLPLLRAEADAIA